MSSPAPFNAVIEDELLHIFAENGLVNDLERSLLHEPEKVDSKSLYGDTPLLYAATSGQEDVCKLLIRFGSDINETNDFSGATPLIKACEYGYAKVVSLLLDHNANIDDRRNDGDSCIHVACAHGHYSVVEILLDDDINIIDMNGHFNNSPLSLACTKGSIDIVALLLAKGANIHSRDSEGLTALHKACMEGHQEIVSLLLNNGANINDVDGDNDTSFHVACGRGRLNIVELFVEQGIDILAYDVDKTNTPLHRACIYGHMNVIHYLISKGYNIHRVNSDGMTCLHSASLTVSKNTKDVVFALIDLGASNDIINNKGKAPFDLIDDSQLVTEIVLYYADSRMRLASPEKKEISPIPLNPVTVTGDGADAAIDIHLFAKNGLLDKLVQAIDSNPSIIDSTNSAGESALHLSCRYGHKELVQELIERNANVHLQTSKGITSLHYACYKGYQDIVIMLYNHGGSLDVKDASGSKPMHVCCSNGHIAIAKLLIDYGSNISDKNVGNNSPFDLVQDPLLKQNLLSYYRAKQHTFEMDNISFEASELSMIHHDKRTSELTDDYTAIAATTATATTATATTAAATTAAAIHTVTPAYLGADTLERTTPSEGRIHAIDIITLAEKGKSGELYEELSLHPNRINEKGAYGNTILHKACRWGHKHLVVEMIHRGANVNEKNTSFNYPLHYACDFGSKDIVIVLLLNGAKVNVINSIGDSPLHRASMKGSVDVVEVLLQYGADYECKNNDNKSPLHIACYNDNKEVAKVLVNNSASIADVDNEDKTPLDYLRDELFVSEVMACARQAASRHSSKVSKEVSVLPTTISNLSKEGDEDQLLGVLSISIDHINYKDPITGYTALMHACQEGHTSIVRILLQFKANVRALDESGFTALHYASSRGDSMIVTMLIESGADVEAKGLMSFSGEENILGDTPVFWSCMNDHVSIVQHLIECGADVNQKNSNGLTLLHLACSRSLQDMIALLIDKGAYINISGQNGRTPLHYAVTEGNISIVTHLSDNGADINARDKNGDSSLHVCASKGYTALFSLLLQMGASTSLRNNSGLLPLDMCINNELLHCELVRTMDEVYRTKLMAVSRSSTSPLPSSHNFGTVLMPDNPTTSSSSSATSSGINAKKDELLRIQSKFTASSSSYPKDMSMHSEYDGGGGSIDSSFNAVEALATVTEALAGPTNYRHYTFKGGLEINDATPFAVNISGDNSMKRVKHFDAIYEGSFKLFGKVERVLIKEESISQTRDIAKEGEMYQYLQLLNEDSNGCIKMYDYVTDSIPKFIIVERFGVQLTSEYHVSKSFRKIIFHNIVAALHHLHSCGIMHGDLKPQNILVYSSNQYQVKLCDLDNARKEGDDFPHFQSKFRCTPEWLSPEVYHGLVGEVKAARSIDVFSLGMIGKLLLDNDSPTEMSTILTLDNMSQALTDQSYLYSLIKLRSNDSDLTSLLMKMCIIEPAASRITSSDLYCTLNTIFSSTVLLEHSHVHKDKIRLLEESSRYKGDNLIKAVDSIIQFRVAGVSTTPMKLTDSTSPLGMSNDTDDYSELKKFIHTDDGVDVADRIAASVYGESNVVLDRLTQMIHDDQTVIIDKMQMIVDGNEDKIVTKLSQEVGSHQDALLARINRMVSDNEHVVLSKLNKVIQNDHHDVLLQLQQVILSPLVALNQNTEVVLADNINKLVQSEQEMMLYKIMKEINEGNHAVALKFKDMVHSDQDSVVSRLMTLLKNDQNCTIDRLLEIMNADQDFIVTELSKVIRNDMDDYVTAFKSIINADNANVLTSITKHLSDVVTSSEDRCYYRLLDAMSNDQDIQVGKFNAIVSGNQNCIVARLASSIHEMNDAVLDRFKAVVNDDRDGVVDRINRYIVDDRSNYIISLGKLLADDRDSLVNDIHGVVSKDQSIVVNRLIGMMRSDQELVLSRLAKMIMDDKDVVMDSIDSRLKQGFHHVIDAIKEAVREDQDALIDTMGVSIKDGFHSIITKMSSNMHDISQTIIGGVDRSDGDHMNQILSKIDSINASYSSKLEQLEAKFDGCYQLQIEESKKIDTNIQHSVSKIQSNIKSLYLSASDRIIHNTSVLNEEHRRKMSSDLVDDGNPIVLTTNSNEQSIVFQLKLDRNTLKWLLLFTILLFIGIVSYEPSYLQQYHTPTTLMSNASDVIEGDIATGEGDGITAATSSSNSINSNSVNGLVGNFDEILFYHHLQRKPLPKWTSTGPHDELK